MGTKVLCEECKKIVAGREVVLTEADVEKGITVESKRAKRIVPADPTVKEVVKTQAQVDAENVPVAKEEKTEVDKSIEKAEKNVEIAKPAKPKSKKKK